MKAIRKLAAGTLLAAAATLTSSVGHAQRFEGIITFKLSGMPGARVAGRSGDGGGAEVRVAEGRGNAGRGGAARAGGTGRGGAATGGAATGSASAGGVAASGTSARVTDRGALETRTGPQLSDEQAAAMRSALATGLQNIEYMTRRGRVRIAVGAPVGGQSPAAMIYAPEDGVMFTLLPAMSLYSETQLADLTIPAEAPTAAAAARPPVVTHTKQFELVAGHKCEHVVIEYAKQKTDICMGKGLGVFVMPTMMGNGGAWTRVISDANGFPLKVIQANGTVTMEVTKIERKSLPEALFNVPDTYTKMPDILRRPPG